MRETRSVSALQEDIARLKDWLTKQPHLPQNVDDEILSSFVYGTKSLEIAKQKLDRFFTLRTKDSKVNHFSYRDPLDPGYKRASRAVKKFFLPGETAEGFRVTFQAPVPNYMEFFDFTQDNVRNFMMLELEMLRSPRMRGLYIIADVKNLTAAVVPMINLFTVSSSMQFIQSGYPLKPQKVILFNAKPFVETMIHTALKPFLSPKIYGRFLVTSEDHNCLKRFLPDAMIPSDYGGSLKSTSDELDEEYKNLVIEHRSWFEKTCKQYVEEKKRPSDGNSTYGVEGTFRNLSLD